LALESKKSAGSIVYWRVILTVAIALYGTLTIRPVDEMHHFDTFMYYMILAVAWMFLRPYKKI